MSAGLPASVFVSVLLFNSLFMTAQVAGQEETPPPPLPEGNAGLAAQYPGDVGIEKDPAVVLYEDFESYTQPADLHERWESVIHEANMRIIEDPGNVHGGKKSVEFTVPRQKEDLAIGFDKTLEQERDVLFLRFYSKFDPGFEVPARHSCHNGGSISASYWKGESAGPGKPADGRNKFLANYENESGYPEGNMPSPGPLNIYLYHPEQRDIYGDHFFPTGIVCPGTLVPFDFGPHFVSRPDITVERGRWYCYEFMVKTNAPGRRDARIACWVDGKIIADFPNLRLRDVDTLKIDRFGVGLYISENTKRANTKWYDDIVAATSYIGPRIDRP